MKNDNSLNNQAENSEKIISSTVTDAPTIVGKEAADIIAEVKSQDTGSETEFSDFDNPPENTVEVSDSSDEDTHDTDDFPEDESDLSENELPEYDDDDEDDFSNPHTISPLTEEPLSDVESNSEQSDNADDTEADENSQAQNDEIPADIKDRIKKLLTLKTVKRAAIAIGALIAAFAIALTASILTLPTTTVAKNVYVEKLNLSGLSYEDALASIKATYLFEDKTVSVTCAQQSFDINGLDIGLVASPEETAHKAFNYGKSGNKFIDGINHLKLLFKKHVIVPVASVDTAKLDEKLSEFGKQIYTELVGHYVDPGPVGSKENTVATVWPGHTGFNNDPSKAREEVLSAFDREDFTNIPVTLESCPPPDLTLEKFDSIVYLDPVDAEYVISGNSVDITPDVTGRYINKEEAAELIKNVHEGGEPIKIPVYPSYAKKTAESLKKKLFNDTLSSYSTDYSSSTSNRKTNVALAASKINGTVVAPGEVFSFNDTVGERTVSNGFRTAKEYVNGQAVDGIGGGTCQVSSTLYAATLYADMEIVSRTNHVMTVSYLPLGMDATVSDGYLDFKFCNSSEYPVKISAYGDGGTLSVSLIGTAWEPEKEVNISNSASYSGGNTIVYSQRDVYENGVCVRNEELPSSYYKPHS